MLFYGKTDIGRRRESNQDNFVIKKYSDEILAAVVCDGMGGVHGGNIASEIAVNAFIEELDSCCAHNPAFSGMDEDNLNDLLRDAVVAANREVYNRGIADTSLTGMGTTLVGCIMTEKSAHIVNVGDSRLYLVSAADGEIEQVTHDHSVVQNMIDKGKLSIEDAKHYKYKSVIMRAVGTQKYVAADVFVCDMKPGTYIVLCSDGLSNLVEPSEIAESVLTIGKTGSIEDACCSLIERANNRGGFDNITAVILGI